MKVPYFCSETSYCGEGSMMMKNHQSHSGEERSCGEAPVASIESITHLLELKPSENAIIKAATGRVN